MEQAFGVPGNKPPDLRVSTWAARVMVFFQIVGVATCFLGLCYLAYLILGSNDG